MFFLSATLRIIDYCCILLYFTLLVEYFSEFSLYNTHCHFNVSSVVIVLDIFVGEYTTADI